MTPSSIWHGLMGLLHIWRRELHSLFVTPTAYLVAALFLLNQGWNFALLLHVLNAPDAAPGPVMQFYFGGSYLIFWLPVVFTCAALSMRLIAEERRQGTLEGLMTAPVRPYQVILGKYLAVLSYYVLLWGPTAVFYLLLTQATPDYAPAPEWGPIAAGYTGTFLIGATFLAIGTWASALAKSQVSAAVGSFVVSSLILLSGLLIDQVESSQVARILQWTSLLSMMREMAQGIVDGHWFSLHASLVVCFLAAAIVAVDTRRDWQSVLQGVCAGIAALCIGVVLGRDAPRWDWTHGRVYSLSERAQTVLQELSDPIEVVVLVPPLVGPGQQNPLRGELLEVLARMQRVTPGLRVRALDPDRDQAEAQRLFAEFRTGGPAVADGVVLVRAGAGAKLKRVVVLPGELVSYVSSEQAQRTGPRVAEFRGEEALLRAFLRVTATSRPRLCYTQNHREPAFDSLEPYGGYANLRDLWRGDNLDLEVADLSSNRGLAHCDVLVVAGPELAFSDAEAKRVSQYLSEGGDLLMLSGAVIQLGAQSLNPHGLEGVLAEYGIRFGERVVLDRHSMSGETPLIAFTLNQGWADHPAVRSLIGRPVSLQLVRELDLRPPAQALLQTDEKAWAESNFAELASLEAAHFDEEADRQGPLAVAAVSEKGASRVVVIASDQFALNARLRSDVVYDHGRDLLLNTVAWITQRDELLGIRAREREHLKLVLLPDQLRRMTWVSVLGLPIFALLLGIWMLWRRRA